MRFTGWEMVFRFVVLLGAVATVDASRVRHHSGGKQGTKHFKNYGIGSHVRRNASMDHNLMGMWPTVFNLATKAVIEVNGTCGEMGREEFCRMVEGGKGRCGICDNYSSDPSKRHPIDHAIDGTSRWWQSPPLHYGNQYEYITIIVDLKQVYQIAYVIVKAANSPRPGTWILERSLDGDRYEPWQYFARSDKECLERFGVPATKGKPHYFTDSEVICTSFYSRLTPMENGEIHTSLVHGRPGANETSPELLEFTKARYVRLRLMGLRGTVEPLPRWFSQDIFKDKRLFYTIRDISIGGQCVCNGHAQDCRHNVASGHPECECGHHTCGPNCEKCCPMYNQRQWGPGSSRDARQCLPCNCHEHAASCHYDEDVDKAGLSMDIYGNYQGGGVCDNCTAHTTGINCEQCMPGFYRSVGTSLDAKKPCVKCDCDMTGSTGACVKDGEKAGECHCLPGFMGSKCESCSPGYRGYPQCEICPCNVEGVSNMEDCEGECICKANVDGKYCDRCKSGFFGLRTSNPEGCTPCVCSGMTTLCESAAIEFTTKIQTLTDWLITDLNVSELVQPTRDDKGIFLPGSFEIPEVKSLYWLAPKPYTGNKLEFYGSTFMFKVHWVIMRGDTSGKPTTGPNIILIGANGIKIAFGNDFFAVSNMTFRIVLKEDGFYHVPRDVQDIVTRLRRTEYKGDPVNRQQFMSVLANIKHVLLRATFHTDQIEALLEEAVLHNDETRESGAVEKCACPSGYTGLSCETCAFGHVRITTNGTDWRGLQGFCGKCDCNGHSESCNPDTGECFCLHYTAGENCERCAPGYYGNPLKGSQEDCRKCACPLEDDENNFSPSCQLDYTTEMNGANGGYVCTQCPKGYTGDHCEICDVGYYGNPQEIGSSCQLCNCNGGPCDRRTGQCLSCKGNTEGWKCEKCKAGYYGDALTANCKPCQCDLIGAVSKDCDNKTGECLCKDRFTGRTCDKCEIGYGNVTALCTVCTCNSIGSKSDICDAHTGLCDCHQGVEGFHCDACQNSHYGFSTTGCKACNCDREGSLLQSCEPITGKCRCRPHFDGLRCDRCEIDYFKADSNCHPCKCNPDGSARLDCNQLTGQCPCKPGVGGLQCTTCLDKHYGNIATECKKCEPCNKEGHICHPETGKCVCPPLTIGNRCENCAKNAWGHEPGIGCKACECSPTGRTKSQCDVLSGRCTCKIGFEGEKCDRCSHGYYGYKNCRRCDCNPSGTIQEDCSRDTCRCTDQGCRCKPNVEGRFCDTCKAGTFAIDHNNPLGCTDCFCFGRSKICNGSDFTWDQIRTDSLTQVTCIKHNAPCWNLPRKFLGDLTLSYGGFLRLSSNSALPSNFQVFLTGNGITIESVVTNDVDLKIREPLWRLVHDQGYKRLPSECDRYLSRPCLMTVLQNVTSIQLETGPSFKTTEFNEVLLDRAMDIHGEPRVFTVERCECPKEYTSLSCQDPDDGYYRYYPKHGETDNYIDSNIGVARRCFCNNYSNICDPKTGHCQNCTNFTKGAHCEQCADGYYKDQSGECLPCLCPSREQNFAKSCAPGHEPNQFICICKSGYTSAKCNLCQDGYYGNPHEDGGLCQDCKCNLRGSRTLICDKVSGVCDCKLGFTGKQCSQCVSPREFIQDGVCTPCDECTQILFRTIDVLSNSLNKTCDLFKNGLAPPWKVFNETLYRYKLLSSKFDDQMLRTNNLIDEVDIGDLENRVENIQKNLNRTSQDLRRQTKSIEELANNSKNISTEVDDLIKRIDEIIDSLNGFGNSHVDTKEALKAAERLLEEIENLIENTPNADNYRLLFTQCQEILDEVNRIYKNNQLNPDGLEIGLKEFKKRLAGLNVLLDQTELLTKLTKNKNKQNSIRIAKLKETISEINAKKSIINNDFMATVKKINATTDVLIEFEKITELLLDLNLEELGTKLESDVDNLPDLYMIFDEVIEHVHDLQEKIKANKNLLNFTNDDWKKINASGAHETLVKGINEAENKANEARKILQDGLRILSPEDDDSLIDKTNLAKAYSDRLKQRILNIENKQKDFQDILERLNELKYDILQNGRSNNDLTSILHNMIEQIAKQSKNFIDLENVKEEACNVSNRMVELEREVKNVNISAQYELFKTYTKYLNLTSKKEISNLMKKISSTRLQLEDIDSNFSQLDVLKDANLNRFQNSGSKLDNFKNKVNELRNKIQYAKEAADSISVAMSFSRCERKYKIPADIFTSLSITFKCISCQLFRLTANGQVMQIVVTENNEISLKLNGTSREIRRKTTDTTTVIVERVGSVYGMKVEETGGTIESKSLYYPKLLKFTENDRIIIGKTSGKMKSANGSCIHRLIVNEQLIGLWNFAETNGTCLGCLKDTNVTEGYILFNGNGYRIVTGARVISPKEFTIKLRITTFDENSLLFLAQDTTDRCSYIVLSLMNGFLNLLVRHIDGTNATLTSKMPYNNGQEATVIAKFVYSHFRQTYKLQSSLDDIITEERKLAPENVFKIKKSQTFIGGVPVVFNKSCIPLHNAQSYLGYLKPGHAEYEDPTRTVSYNTKLQTGPLQFNKALFSGEGFLEVETNNGNNTLHSISFLLKQPKPNGFVLDINENLQLYLKNNELVLKVDNQNTVIGKSPVQDLYYVELTIKENEIDSVVNGQRNHITGGMIVSDRLNFFIGNDRTKQHGFHGGISDIVVNNKTFMLNNITIKSFSKVQIGREKLLSSQSPSFKSALGPSIDTNSIKDMQNTQGCPVISNYETDPDAVKFGDKTHSFISIENAFWKKDYVLEFEFRTFYMNGLLFVAAGAHQQKHYNVLEIQEGKLRLRIKGKKVKAIIFPNRINDGMWHKVEISQIGVKKKRKLTIKLDGEAKKPMRVPKNNLKNEMFVGGLPENFPDHIQLGNQLHQFRGCMRSLKINNVLQTLVKNKKSVSYNNIGQCFTYVERGAYFGGDAYAIYRGDFTVNKLLELSFEFKTVEQNGILLSVSNLGNSPALSVELQNGAIVMSIDMGNGVISNVTNSLDSEFILCNNRWHNITALYSSYELTVNVDGIRKSWVQYDYNSLMGEIEAPLYVGGLPDNAPTGTLKIKENFKGCIRKLKIDDRLMDWTDMKELKNVLLNACPVVST